MPNADDVLARHLNLLRKCGNKSGHQSFGREMGSRHAGAHDAHQNGLNAYATEPGPQSDFDSDSPASTRGLALKSALLRTGLVRLYSGEPHRRAALGARWMHDVL